MTGSTTVASQRMQRVRIEATHVSRAALLAVGAVCLVAMFDSPSVDAFYGAKPPPFDLTELVIVVAGVAIGCYGTLVGIGGGALVVPVLVTFYGWPARDVVGTALLVVCLNALSGTLRYAQQRRIDYQGGLKFAFAALPGAALSALVHRYWNVASFDTIFGVFLLTLSALCLLGGGVVSQAEQVQREDAEPGHRVVAFEDRFGVRYRFAVNDSVGTSLNFLLGFMVGFLGIGGGVLQVPMLVYLLRYPVHVATATSHFVTLLATLFALAPSVAFGNVRLGLAFWMGLGVVVGAQIGAWLSPNVRSQRIIHLFIGIVILFGLRLLLS